MIVSVSTYSRAQAQAALSKPVLMAEDYSNPDYLHEAWIGFATRADGRSPIDTAKPGCRPEMGLVTCVHDVGCDEASAAAYDPIRAAKSTVEPRPEQADSIVNFVMLLHRDDKRWRLNVHCHGGQYRSGAVAEWMILDLGVPELPESCRLQVFGIGRPLEKRTYNATILRLLRESYARWPERSYAALRP